MDIRICRFRQEQALLSILPLCSLNKKLFEASKRNMLTSAAASCYPFTSFEMSDENGILLGVNQHNNSLVIVDIFNSRVYEKRQYGSSGNQRCRQNLYAPVDSSPHASERYPGLHHSTSQRP